MENMSISLVKVLFDSLFPLNEGLHLRFKRQLLRQNNTKSFRYKPMLVKMKNKIVLIFRFLHQPVKMNLIYLLKCLRKPANQGETSIYLADQTELTEDYILANKNEMLLQLHLGFYNSQKYSLLGRKRVI